MIHQGLLLICVFLAVSRLAETRTFDTSNKLQVSWRNCGPSSDPVQLKGLTISPDPIRLSGNLTIDASGTVTKSIPNDVHASISLERKVGPFYVKVPCVNNFGSCTYTNVCDLWAQYCPKKYGPKYDVPCQCPIPANTYSVSNANIFIGKTVPPELVGEYRATADFTSSEGHLACLYIDLTVRN